MFMSGSDFNYEMMMARSYVEGDVGQTVVLYEVDLDTTQVSDIYMESSKNNIRFKTPIELPVIYELEEANLKQYDKNFSKAVYVQLGKLTFGVFESTLQENECDIKRGDYIGLQVTTDKMEFFTVVNDGRINYSNNMSYYGRQPYYRKVVCAPVDKNEFNG